MGHRNMRAHTNTHTYTLISSPLLIYFLFHTIPALLHTVKHICNHAQNHIQSTYTYASAESWIFLILLFIFPFIHCQASIRCTFDKPVWFSFLPAFIYMQLSSKTNSRPCKADSISVSPSSSHYTPHELCIGVNVERSDRSNRGQSLGPC